MKKAIWVAILFVIAIVIGFFVGTYLYNKEEKEKKMENEIKNITYHNNIINSTNIIEVQTSLSEEKISVNTQVIEEIYYTQCDHLVKTTRKDIKSLVNMTKEELAKKYENWEVKQFSKEQVLVYKTEQDFCNEHYLVKDLNGFVTIYNMDNEDKIKERIETTEIETKYLTETDQEDLKEGIMVYTQQKLNKLIEDFE